MEDQPEHSVSNEKSTAVGERQLHRGDYGAETELQRHLSTRHVTMIALGSSIGMGLWLGSGKSLASGGPVGIFLGYILAGSMVWAVSHSIGELAVLYPLPSAFVQWTGKFVSPSAAFSLGWAYWFNYILTVANEIQVTSVVMGFWTDDLPNAAWITIFWAVVTLANVFGVKVFGEIEVVGASIKFGWIIVVIFSLIVTSAGGAPGHGPIGFRYWNSDPFTHGFKGFLSVMPTCIFAMAGSENCGLVAAETRNPRRSVPRAVGSIWLRLSLFYILGAMMVTINVDPHNKDLFGQSGTNASPFVIAYREARLPALAHMMNAVILISVVTTGTIYIYSGSRNILGLAHLGMAPKQFKHADDSGRPWPGLVLSIILGGGLAYLNVKNSSADVFSWLSNMTSLFTLFGWGMICLAHIRFRHAWHAQGRSDSDLPWKSWTYPYSAWWGLIWCMVLIVVEFYLAVWPLGLPPSAKNFFSNYVSVIAIVVLYLGARTYYRGPWWIKLTDIDLDANRRFYVDTEIEKVPEKGLRGKAEKVLGFLFN
ncbi:hypothetical protein DPSP01_009405 [Paraphaeosphaeria sporulosa]|uniref:Amino acid permease/ SLC12A domain-containing protein n=1 Tax=Paraphaeosphaeria sporulosa TaxID=1460663 RepID=A0A177CLW4_9PLEO|nr:uncharacterized protein CC84DRAFT_564799 [Paraphaeosphaeria sporulosa]OAG08296.1 hypothetical protein CC84DRAFT_564799 [Paraphaeosphaeria sporulosa]